MGYLCAAVTKRFHADFELHKSVRPLLFLVYSLLGPGSQ